MELVYLFLLLGSSFSVCYSQNGICMFYGLEADCRYKIELLTLSRITAKINVCDNPISVTINIKNEVRGIDVTHTFEGSDTIIMVYGFDVETKLRVRLAHKDGEILHVDVDFLVYNLAKTDFINQEVDLKGHSDTCLVFNEATKIAVGVMCGLAFIVIVLVIVLLYIRYRHRKEVADGRTARDVMELQMMPPEYSPNYDSPGRADNLDAIASARYNPSRNNDQSRPSNHSTNHYDDRMNENEANNDTNNPNHTNRDVTYTDDGGFSDHISTNSINFTTDSNIAQENNHISDDFVTRSNSNFVIRIDNGDVTRNSHVTRNNISHVTRNDNGRMTGDNVARNYDEHAISGDYLRRNRNGSVTDNNVTMDTNSHVTRNDNVHMTSGNVHVARNSHSNVTRNNNVTRGENGHVTRENCHVTGSDSVTGRSDTKGKQSSMFMYLAKSKEERANRRENGGTMDGNRGTRNESRVARNGSRGTMNERGGTKNENGSDRDAIGLSGYDRSIDVANSGQRSANNDREIGEMDSSNLSILHSQQNTRSDLDVFYI